jgi:hypothetical protein
MWVWLGAMTVTTGLFDRSFTTPGDQEVYASPPGHQGADGHAALSRVLRPFTTAQVQTLADFIAGQETTLGTLLNLFYVLLALCVIISLFGIVNTLALSITERTREIGMLRAIGMTRTQLRRMIRIESEIIALIGATVRVASGCSWPASPPTRCRPGASASPSHGSLSSSSSRRPSSPGRWPVSGPPGSTRSPPSPTNRRHPMSALPSIDVSHPEGQPSPAVLIALTAGPRTLREIEDAFRGFGRRLPHDPRPYLAGRRPGTRLQEALAATLTASVRSGWVVQDGERFNLTDAGRLQADRLLRDARERRDSTPRAAALVRTRSRRSFASGAGGIPPMPGPGTAPGATSRWWSPPASGPAAGGRGGGRRGDQPSPAEAAAVAG